MSSACAAAVGLFFAAAATVADREAVAERWTASSSGDNPVRLRRGPGAGSNGGISSSSSSSSSYLSSARESEAAEGAFVLVFFFFFFLVASRLEVVGGFWIDSVWDAGDGFDRELVACLTLEGLEGMGAS